MPSQFTWLPFFEEMLSIICKNYNKHSLFEVFCKIDRECDGTLQKDGLGDSRPIKEIDPVTFIGYFYHVIRDFKRTKYCAVAKKYLRMDSEVPQDFSGIASQHNLSVTYSAKRGTKEIDELWKFSHALNEGNVNNEIFSSILNLYEVGLTRLSGVMFVCKPDKYISFHTMAKEYFKEKGFLPNQRLFSEIENSTNSFELYTKFINKVKETFQKPFYEISNDANIWYKNKSEITFPQDRENTMKVYFGKISKEIDSSQIQDGYYRAAKDSSWFNGIQPGDYSYIIGGGKIQLWKAKEWGQKDGNDILIFDIIHKDLGIDTKQLTAIKYFNITKELVVLTVRSTAKSKKAFFPIAFDSALTEEMLIDVNIYKDPNTYRNIHILGTQSVPVRESEDVQLYKEENRWKLFNSPFISKQIIDSFRDNTNMLGKGRDNKDKTIRIIISPNNAGRKLPPEDLSILQIYDLFCCDYNSKEIIDDPDFINNESCNIILYGPPGTGKTYRVYEKAVQLIEPDFPTDDRPALMSKFKQLQNEHNIEFVTFHQSYSYEEFIEGIRPVIEDGLMRYEVKDGILKTIAKMAATEFTNVAAKSDIAFNSINVFKMSLGNTAISEEDSFYDYCIENNCIGLGWGSMVDFTPVCEYKGKELRTQIERLFSESSHDEKKVFAADAVYRFIGQMKIGDLVLISKGNRIIRAAGRVVGNYEYKKDADIRYYHYRKVEWLLKDVEIPAEKISQKNLSQQAIYTFDKQSLFLDNLAKLLQVDKKSKQIKNYVLIIDEINRGNISKIFGEAITLLDADKRIDAENETVLTLPYSNDKFGLPRNLYIIGTMNTADRSIALMDIALRRRFEFEDVMPDSKVIRDVLEQKETKDSLVSLVLKVFTVLNCRIEVLLDREHQIGHSYFLDIDNESKLYDVWYRKIIPLLQEYFYNDWERLEKLLGSKANGDGLIVSTKDNPEYKNLFNGDEVDFPCQIYKCANETELCQRLSKVFDTNGK